MAFRISRRRFITGLGATATLPVVCNRALAALVPADRAVLPDSVASAANGLLYPPIDLSYFDRPIAKTSAEFRLGYASITWAGQDREAIADIASLGFRGVQLRANAIQEFGSASELKDLLTQQHLAFVALSSGAVRVDPAFEAEDLAKHTSNARFVHEAGGLYLQLTDQRPKDRPLSASDFKRLGRLLTEIGKRAADLGVSVGYHNHMGSMGEKPEDVDRILHEADSRYVKLELDIAHYLQGGGDPAAAIRRYHNRLLFLHIKDVQSVDPPINGKNYRFVELGHGRLDLPATFAALRQVHFRGWTVVELDAVPDKARTAKESAVICKNYLEAKLGLTV